MAEPGLTVLVVEDEATLRVLVERILVTGGHRSVVCASAEEAIELVEAGQIGYDVLLTDVVLDGPGGLDGHDVVAAVCRRRPDAGIVMMSGRLEAEVLARIPDGCRPRFVAKPYTKETLLGTVRDAWADARPSGRSRG